MKNAMYVLVLILMLPISMYGGGNQQQSQPDQGDQSGQQSQAYYPYPPYMYPPGYLAPSAQPAPIPAPAPVPAPTPQTAAPDFSVYNAVAHGDVTGLRLAINLGKNVESTPDPNNETPLMLAASKTSDKDQNVVANYRVITKLLLERGASGRATDAQGHTALDYAVDPTTKTMIKNALEGKPF